MLSVVDVVASCGGMKDCIVDAIVSSKLIEAVLSHLGFLCCVMTVKSSCLLPSKVFIASDMREYFCKNRKTQVLPMKTNSLLLCQTECRPVVIPNSFPVFYLENPAGFITKRSI